MSKQHVSAIHGHHQVLFVPIKVSLYKSRDLYSETLIGTDKTWWWSWMPETCCFDIDINFQEYTSFISYELCYWLPSHI